MRYTTVDFDNSEVFSVEPGDATHYETVYGMVQGRLFFAFNSGDADLVAFLWPTYLGYVSYSYFVEKMGKKFESRWTRGVAYLILLHLLGLELDERDLEKEALPWIREEGRLKSGWLDIFTVEKEGSS